jgi:hypothetical protein
MIAGPYDVLPVRQTATTSGNASRRPVGRISVGSGLICLALGFASIAGAADAKKEPEIRIIPGPRSHHMLPPMSRMPPTSPMPQYEERRPAPATKRPGKPAIELPPLPAEPVTPKAKPKAKPAPPQHHKQQQAGGLRIIPGHRATAAASFQRYQQIYRSIPYSRTEYELDPMYRQELALSLLFNRFPPAPIMMQPGSSGMGQQGPMSGPMSNPMTAPGGWPSFGIPLNGPPFGWTAPDGMPLLWPPDQI